MNTYTKAEPREIFATVGGIDYCVKVKFSNGGNGEDFYWWVEVQQYQPDLNWWKCVFSDSTNEEAQGEMDAIRWVFKRQRSRMRSWLQSWIMHRQSAAAEKGGKRAYYSKWANKALKIAVLDYAPKWKLGKAIWKEITKL